MLRRGFVHFRLSFFFRFFVTGKRKLRQCVNLGNRACIKAIFETLSSNNYLSIMNTRISSSILRLVRSSCARTLPSQLIHRNSLAPRCFSSLSSRLYASIATPFGNAVSHLCVGNVKRYTEQHEWIEIDNDNIGIILPSRMRC